MCVRACVRACVCACVRVSGWGGVAWVDGCMGVCGVQSTLYSTPVTTVVLKRDVRCRLF